MDANQELAEALDDLKGSPDEAKEEGYSIPSGTTMRNAERILRAMHRIWPRRYEVYPMSEGEIAVDAPCGEGRSFMVVCDQNGGGFCLLHDLSSWRKVRFTFVADLPEGLLREMLEDMGVLNEGEGHEDQG